MKLIKRFMGGCFLLAILGLLSFLALAFYARGQQRDWRRALDQRARLAQEQARDVLADFNSRQGDVELVIGRPVVEMLIAALEGLESEARLARIAITHVEPEFRTGYIRVTGEAELRSLYYNGVVDVIYYVFSEIADDGACRLVFRVASVSPRDWSFLGRNGLEWWVVHRLQSRMRMPEITLPLGFEESITLSERKKTTLDDQVEVHIPERSVDLKVTGARVVIAPEFIAVQADQFQVGDGETIAPKTPASVYDPPPEEPTPLERIPPEGISFSIDFNVFNQVLAHIVAPPGDVYLSADHVERVWEEEKRVLGMRRKNYADLHEVDGRLDVEAAYLEADHLGLLLHLEVGGLILGDVSGSVYGVKLRRPFKVVPEIKEMVPLIFQQEDDHLLLKPEARTLELPLRIETRLVGQKITFTVDVDVEAEKLMRPLAFPLFFSREIEVPTRIRRKEVLESKTVLGNLTWDLRLPEDTHGRLRLKARPSLGSSPKEADRQESNAPD